MLPIDQLAYSNAYRDIHPLEKGIFAFIFLFFSLLFKNTASTIITFLLMSAAIVIGARIPLLYYLKLLLLPFLFLTTSVLTILISYVPANLELTDALISTVVGQWKFYIGNENLRRVIQIIFAVMAGISCMYFFILTTPIQQMIWLLQKIRLPELFIELFVLTYRFIFVLMKNMNEIRKAQTSRLGYCGYKQSFYSFGQLVMGVLLKSMKTAKEVQMAVDSRGTGGGFLDDEGKYSYERKNWMMIMFFFLFLSFITAVS